MQRTGRAMALLAALGGCGSAVVGDDPHQVELVEGVRAELEDLSGVELDVSVRLRSDFDRAEGRYNAVTRRITLDSTVSDETLVSNTRHELCHALDFQLPFRSVDHPQWRIAHESLRYGSERRQRREAFAAVCEADPRANLAVLPCGQSELDDELQRIRDALFAHGVRPLELELDVQASTLFDGELRQVRASEGGRLRFTGERDVAIVSIETGAEAAGDATDPFGEPETVDEVLLAGWHGEDPQQVGDQLVGIAERWLPDGSELRQLFVRDADGALGTACAPEGTTFFAYAEQVWWARSDGATVRWGSLESH